jgi:hypothetical protein
MPRHRYDNETHLCEHYKLHMRTFLLAGLALVFLASSPAFAQQARPCERGQSRLSFGALDMDELRCEQALMQQQVGSDLASLEAKVAANAAAAVMAKRDLAEAQKHLEDWAKYFSAYIGADKPKEPAPAK